MRNKIKTQLKRFKKWILISIFGIGIVLAATIGNGTIPANLQLKVSPDRILSDITTQDIRCDKNDKCVSAGLMKKYAYISLNTVEPRTYKGISEDLAKRTNFSHRYHLGKTKKGDMWAIEIYPGIAYYKIDNIWFYVESATTTIEAYGKQITQAYSPLNPIEKFIGKIYAGTIYPVPGTTDDGLTYRNAQDQTFAAIIAAVGLGSYTSTQDAATIEKTFGIVCSGTTNQFEELSRYAACFDTSETSGQTIDSVTFSIYGQSATDHLSITAADRIAYLVAANMPNIALVQGSDYQRIKGSGTVSFGTFDPGAAYANWSTTAYNDWTLNASGKSYVNATTTCFAVRSGADFNGSFTSTWVASDYTRLKGYYAGNTGTSQDPKLVITYAGAGIPSSIESDLIIFEE